MRLARLSALAALAVIGGGIEVVRADPPSRDPEPQPAAPKNAKPHMGKKQLAKAAKRAYPRPAPMAEGER